MQTTSHLLMIRPVQFTFNAETAVNNAFQSTKDDNAQETALKEFDGFVNVLRAKGVDVTLIDDTKDPHTPDSIFPNNWISFHSDGRIVLYPMYAVNRRQERKPHVIEKVKSKFRVNAQVDLSSYENKNVFLEGTGSMVLDRENKIAYACLSQRTDMEVLNEFCAQLGFQPVAFVATDSQGFPIYHTNVMMCVADRFVVICLESVKDEQEKKKVIAAIEKTGKEIIAISLDQMNQFAGNMLQVQNKAGEKFLVMSSQAYRSLTKEQVASIEKYNAIIHSSLDTIERNGGGSARCMMAEIFLPPKEN
ncbi:MAG: amidinotransferase [Bacteroidetes bacterium]|nr:amidinotransferase [Bacteroidota bacterium]